MGHAYILGLSMGGEITVDLALAYPEMVDALVLAKFNAVESRLGFPTTKKRYRCYFGGHDTNTLVVEYEWDSLTAMEAAYEKAMADPEWQVLGAKVESVIKSDQMELYVPLQ